eukprot:14261114-Heterocapsa_arctica.AAC.1
MAGAASAGPRIGRSGVELNQDEQLNAVEEMTVQLESTDRFTVGSRCGSGAFALRLLTSWSTTA